MKTTLVALAVLVLAPAREAGSQAPARSDLQHKLEACQVAGVKDPALCGHYEVPEVRGAEGSRRVKLNIVVLPATTDSIAGDPLVFLAGGGVVPATRYAGFLTRAFPTLRQHRDILLIDQRGTWNSSPLACEPGPGPASEDGAASIRSCLDDLTKRADLRAYSTAAAMDDLDAVREWLGYRTISLYGVSYGTKAAQVYLKQHPQRVRSVVLYGVVPLSAPTQLDLAANAQRTLERVFALCATDATCQAAFPSLGVELDSTLARLARAPATASLERSGAPAQTIEVTDRMLRDVVQTMLGSARSIERLPRLIHAAYGGDYRSVGRVALGDGPLSLPPAPRGVFFSILCAESIPLIEPSRVAPATAGTFFGATPVQSQIDACAEWPRAALPAGFWEPARADVPVLAITGDLDPITPPSYGELVTSSLRNARHIVIPNRSHGDVDPCITTLFERFLIDGGAGGLDTSCAAVQAPLRFATDITVPR